MLLVRILLGLLLGYALLVLLAWVFQERIAFPAPRAPVPDPRQVGAANRARIHAYGTCHVSPAASHGSARHEVAGVVLDAPFTNAGVMARAHYALFPRFIVRLRLDSLANLRLAPSAALVFPATGGRRAPP